MQDIGMTGWTLAKFEKLLAYSKYLHHCDVIEAVCVCVFFSVVLIHSHRIRCAFYCYCSNCMFGRLILCFARCFRFTLSFSRSSSSVLFLLTLFRPLSMLPTALLLQHLALHLFFRCYPCDTIWLLMWLPTLMNQTHQCIFLLTIDLK